jgi:hypothetical protein
MSEPASDLSGQVPTADTRGEEEKSDKTAIRELAEALKDLPAGTAKIEAVSVLGFAVSR